MLLDGEYGNAVIKHWQYAGTEMTVCPDHTRNCHGRGHRGGWLVTPSRGEKGFQGFPAVSGDSALFLCKRKLVRWLEKKSGWKKIILSKSRSWVKANLGLCLWIPIVIPKGTLYGPNKDYNRDLIRITIGVQRHHAEVCLHPSRDLLKINIFHPYFFLDTVWCSWSIKKERNRQNYSQTSQNYFSETIVWFSAQLSAVDHIWMDSAGVAL